MFAKLCSLSEIIETPLSSREGFDGAVVCTDCMETGSSYSKDPDYLTHGFGPARGVEYQQQFVPPPPYPHRNPAEQHDTGSHTAPLCNGTPYGIRKDIQGSTLPKYHNIIQMNQEGRKGEESCRTFRGQLIPHSHMSSHLNK